MSDKMTDFSQLAQQINSAFPRVEAPEEFRAYCQKTISETPDPQAYGLGDYVHMALAYRGLPWWELTLEYVALNGLTYPIETGSAFLDAEARCYYIPAFLLFYVEEMRAGHLLDATDQSSFINRFFCPSVHWSASFYDALPLQQKRCIAQVIKSAATDVPAGESAIEPECLAYWSQFL